MKKILFFFIGVYFISSFSLFTCYAQNKTELWGMTNHGGNGTNGQGGGVIFKTDQDGNNLKVVHSFIDIPGQQPTSDLCKASNGKLYGMTKFGGAYSFGVLFEYDPSTGAYTRKLDFEGPTNGRYPIGPLMQGSDGKLYGMTSQGGVKDCGVLFGYDPVTNIYIKKWDFIEAISGNRPCGSLMQTSDGKLYGMTQLGGTNHKGVLFEYDLSDDTLIKKLDFAGRLNGSYPWGALIQASNGKLFGLTVKGGINDMGVLFEYDSNADLYTKKTDFFGGSLGGNPYGSLMQASNGKLYGMTYKGGGNDDGILYEYNLLTNSYTKKFSFSIIGGKNSYGSLMQASDGKLYGMISEGGTNTGGLIFEYDFSTDTLIKKLDFDNASNGASPLGSLIETSDGKLYGMTSEKGKYNSGILFEYNISNSTFTKKLDFEDAFSGKEPNGSLTQAYNGKLYGMTKKGGVIKENTLSEGGGVLFEFDPTTNIFTKKLDFLGLSNGRNPSGSLIQASDGQLYGMAPYGGTNDLGILFKYNPTNDSLTKILDFSGAINGSIPLGDLMQATNGKLYGLTLSGGIYDRGILFEYDPLSSTFTKRYDFICNYNECNFGIHPEGSLIQATNGKLYSMTSSGGIYSRGVLFEYDPIIKGYSKKYDFKGYPDGERPNGSLLKTTDGRLYGMTGQGGANLDGVLFEYELVTNTYSVKYDFSTISGSSPSWGSLMQASNGKLYGMTDGGGIHDMGVLFEFDPTINKYTKKIDFYGLIGEFPVATHLIEIWVQPQILDDVKDAVFCSGSDGSFSVDARGYNLSYKWQVDKGFGFNDINDDSTYINETSKRLGIAKTLVSMNGYRFRCEVKSSCPSMSIFSDTAVLFIKSIPYKAESISGLDLICQGQDSVTYAVPTIEGSASYIWALPPGATGKSTTDSIKVNYTTSAISGNISVKGYNLCGDGGQSTLPISVKIKPEAPTITLQGNTLHSIINYGNQWYNQNGLINGATDQDYLVSSVGTYYDIVTTNECSSGPSNIINIAITGIEYTENNKLIKVYPNPVSTELIIEIEGSTDLTRFEILNLAGQIILKGCFVERTVIQTKDLHPGIYLIKIENSKIFEFKKIVK